MADGWREVLKVGFYEEPNVGYGVYRLHFNENLFLPREYYEEVLRVSLEPNLVRYYTEPLNPSFNRALAKLVGVDEDNVFATAGGDEGIRLLIQMATHGSGKLLVVEPTYSMPRAVAESMNIKVVESILKPNYQIDVDDVVKKGAEADVIYICNPNNPTANLFSKRDIEQVASSLNSLIIIDEAYAEFAGVSMVDLVKRLDNVAVVRTFSKAWGLAGLRVGYIVASKTIVDGLRRISLPHNIPYPSIAMVLRAIELRHYVERSIEEMVKVRGYLIGELRRLSIDVLDSVTNFVTFHINDPDGVYGELYRRGFVLRNLSGKVLCEDCLRATVPPMDIAERLVEELVDVLGIKR